MADDPTEPGALYERLINLEDALHVTLAILFRADPDGLALLEDHAVRLNPPSGGNSSQKALLRLSKKIGSYQRVFADMARDQLRDRLDD